MGWSGRGVGSPLAAGSAGGGTVMQSEPGVVRLNCNPSRRPGCLGRRDGLKTDRKSMSHPLARIRVPRENKQKSRVGFFRWEIQRGGQGMSCEKRQGKEEISSSFTVFSSFEHPCLLFVCVGRSVGLSVCNWLVWRRETEDLFGKNEVGIGLNEIGARVWFVYVFKLFGIFGWTIIKRVGFCFWIVHPEKLRIRFNISSWTNISICLFKEIKLKFREEWGIK